METKEQWAKRQARKLDGHVTEQVGQAPKTERGLFQCDYCHGVGSCPRCWGRAGIDELYLERDRLAAEKKELVEALEDAVGAAEYVVGLCEANHDAGIDKNPNVKSDWVGTVAHCYAAMNFVGKARAVLARAGKV